MSLAGRLAIDFVLVLVAVLVAVTAGSVGYYVGSNARPAPTQSPVWTDREQTITSGSSDGSTYIVTLRCTYHLADGTTRRTKSALVVQFGAARTPDSRTCPSPP